MDPPKQIGGYLEEDKNKNGYWEINCLVVCEPKQKSFVSNRFRLAKQVQSGISKKKKGTHT